MEWTDSDDDLLSVADLTAFKKPAVSCKNNVTPLKHKVKSVPLSSLQKNSWVCSSFEDFNPTPTSQIDVKEKQTRKRSRDVRNKKQPASISNNSTSAKSLERDLNNEKLWAEKHCPDAVHELAVHKKKIEEVNGYLTHFFQVKKHHEAPILLLTGPTGCGKTACVKAICKQCSLEIQEWINPVSSSTGAFSQHLYEDFKSFTSVGLSASDSQTSQFQDFILRANKYPTLSIFNQDQLYKKIILVEDFPNIFFRDVAQFHQILRLYHKRGHAPLVFIVSDNVTGESNERLLFPKHIQAELNITNISFNPVAPTSLTKVLQRIATLEAAQGRNKGKFQAPDKATIDHLASSSNGDIRGAINALQFTCLKGEPIQNSKNNYNTKDKAFCKSKKSRGKKSVTKDEKKSVSIGEKDTSLFIFRALGKILYCKRDQPTSDSSTLPNHLLQHYRDPLSIDPEDVLEKSHLSSDFFTAYLHQNYPEFYSNIEDVVSASNYISDADYLTVEWTNRPVLNTYASSIAARGIMFSNTDRATCSSSTGSKLGWKPLHKPQWFEASKKARNNITEAKSLFSGHCSSTLEVQTLLVPYMSMINASNHDPVRKKFIKEVGVMSRYIRNNSERLDEKDVSLPQALSEEISQDQSVIFAETRANNGLVNIGHSNNSNMEKSNGNHTVTDCGEHVGEMIPFHVDFHEDEAQIEDFDD